MQSRTIAITGSKGLIGHPLCQKLQDKHRIIPLDISDETRPVDITKLSTLDAVITQSQPDVLIHLAAFTDVSAAWEQQGDTQGSAYKVNVLGTENVAKVCSKAEIQVVHLSTSFVFDGEKKSPYLESDTPNPIEWYGQTKALAEEAIMRESQNWTILRIDQPFHHLPSPTKPDLAHTLATNMRSNQLQPQFSDHYFGPTYIPDLILVIEQVIETSLSGLFHATNNESWTNYDFATTIADSIGYDGKIEASLLAEYLKTSQRPYQKNSALNSSHLYQTLNQTPTSISDALKKLKGE
ncbi:MAG: SDR family oxidoreductase [Patescibacteria group bacterium]